MQKNNSSCQNVTFVARLCRNLLLPFPLFVCLCSASTRVIFQKSLHCLGGLSSFWYGLLSRHIFSCLSVLILSTCWTYCVCLDFKSDIVLYATLFSNVLFLCLSLVKHSLLKLALSLECY